MATTTDRKLFSPVQIGATALGHRGVVAPLTRSRSEQPGDVPGKLMLEYHTQRASESGLIISEATTIAISGRGWYGAPGLYSDEQVVGWKRIVSAVHAKSGRMFSQLWHVGRSSNVEMTNGAAPLAPSVVPSYWLESTPSVSAPSGWLKPSPHRALDIVEIPSKREAPIWSPLGDTSLRIQTCRNASSWDCRSTCTTARLSTHSTVAVKPIIHFTADSPQREGRLAILAREQ